MNGNGFNESLSVENDSSAQFWKPMGMALMRREVPEQMTTTALPVSTRPCYSLEFQ